MAVKHDQENLTNVVELDWFADNDIVRVTPRNQIRFDIQKDHAIRVLQAQQDRQRFERQFDLMIQQLAIWVQGHADKIRDAYLTLESGAFSFVITQKESECDDDFQDALSSLDFRIANDPDMNLIELESSLLPPVSPSAIASFVDKNLNMRFVHGERS